MTPPLCIFDMHPPLTSVSQHISLSRSHRSLTFSQPPKKDDLGRAKWLVHQWDTYRGTDDQCSKEQAASSQCSVTSNTWAGSFHALLTIPVSDIHCESLHVNHGPAVYSSACSIAWVRLSRIQHSRSINSTKSHKQFDRI